MIGADYLKEMDPLTLGIISSLIATGIIAIVLFILKRITNFSRVRELWGRYTTDFTLFSGQIYFKEHHHRYMAAGDIRAILSIALTIQSIFKLKKIPHRFSNATIPNEDLRGNIFSVGGPKFNLRIPCGLPQGDIVKYIKISGAAKQHHLGVIPCGLATGIVKVKEIFYSCDKSYH